jgi:DNA polymerase I-like protein with 3'-5' exonuclease and polymerase domains
LDEEAPSVVERPVARIVRVRVREVRYFWQLPFNPDAPAQILSYLAQQGIEAPLDKKTKRATTNKKALDALKAQHRDDPFFQLQMDYKAVAKVDSTYAVGSLAKLDDDDRLHPEFLPKPSTFRDSCQNPNLQNVVADKAGAEGLAAGFRRCIEARDGAPAGTTEDMLRAWRSRWT